MKKIHVIFDREGNTLDVWFDKPQEAICEETGQEVILKKDPKTHEVIGFEKLNFSRNPAKLKNLPIELEVK